MIGPKNLANRMVKANYYGVPTSVHDIYMPWQAALVLKKWGSKDARMLGYAIDGRALVFVYTYDSENAAKSRIDIHTARMVPYGVKWVLDGSMGATMEVDEIIGTMTSEQFYVHSLEYAKRVAAHALEAVD